MILLERLLFYPVVIAATVVALIGVSQHPGPLAYASLGWVAALWILVFVRSLLWLVRTLFWLTVLAAAGGLALWLPYARG